MTETRQRMIDRLIGERKLRETVMNERSPGVFVFAYLIGDAVRMKLDDSVRGYVRLLEVTRGGALYHVSWGDRTTTAHFDFELKSAESDD